MDTDFHQASLAPTVLSSGSKSSRVVSKRRDRTVYALVGALVVAALVLLSCISRPPRSWNSANWYSESSNLFVRASTHGIRCANAQHMRAGLGTRFVRSAATQQFVLDPFVLRQFDDKKFSGTRIEYPKAAFEAKINQLFSSGKYPLVDGYAPFCKHLFIPNFVGVRLNYLEITAENEGKMRSGYEARTEKELPVLVRWFPMEGAPEPAIARYLDVILYSREQIRKEAIAMGREADKQDAPWGIISVKAQDVDYELPMQPITMMRNAFGKEEGGSGVSLDRQAYAKSVNFWSRHAPIQ